MNDPGRYRFFIYLKFLAEDITKNLFFHLTRGNIWKESILFNVI